MLHVKTLAKGDLTKKGEREVFFEMNGQLRSVIIKDSEAQKVSIIIKKLLTNTPDI